METKAVHAFREIIAARSDDDLWSDINPKHMEVFRNKQVSNFAPDGTPKDPYGDPMKPYQYNADYKPLEIEGRVLFPFLKGYYRHDENGARRGKWFVYYDTDYSKQDIARWAPWCPCERCSRSRFNPVKYLTCGHCCGCLHAGKDYANKRHIETARSAYMRSKKKGLKFSSIF